MFSKSPIVYMSVLSVAAHLGAAVYTYDMWVKEEPVIPQPLDITLRLMSSQSPVQAQKNLVPKTEQKVQAVASTKPVKNNDPIAKTEVKKRPVIDNKIKEVVKKPKVIEPVAKKIKPEKEKIQKAVPQKKHSEKKPETVVKAPLRGAKTKPLQQERKSVQNDSVVASISEPATLAEIEPSSVTSIKPTLVLPSTSGISNPEPKYPYSARKRGLQGVVVLSVTVAPDGSVAEISIHQSSGHKVLDRSAIKTIKNWYFSPARLGDKPVVARLQVPIRFQLNKG